MIENRKGLSDVVTTVLIILLVLAAVVIVGSYVLNFAKKGGETVTAGSVCQGLDIEVTACKKATGSGTSVVPGSITYKISAGEVGKVSKIRVLGYMADGTSLSAEDTTPVKLYESEKVDVVGSDTTTKQILKGSAGVVDVNVDGIVTACQFKESRQVDCS